MRPRMARHIAESRAALSQARSSGPREALGFEALTGDKPVSLRAMLELGMLSFARGASN